MRATILVLFALLCSCGRYNAPCGDGDSCESEGVQTCLLDQECPGGQVCHGILGVCVECENSGNCPIGEVCSVYACILGCRNSGECQDGQTCVAGECQ
ncbi:MAG: hypothetical protein WC551_10175 [Patescibacteria group bacterium]|jgi:hypothetical protein